MDYIELQRLADEKSSIEFVKDDYGRDRGDFIINNPVFIYHSNFGGELRKTRDGRVVNSAGNRNFNVVVPSQYVNSLAEKSYKIKEAYSVDEAGRTIVEDGPFYTLNIKVKYTNPLVNEKAAHFNSQVYKLCEVNGKKLSNLMEFYDDPKKGIGMLDDDSNGRKANGEGMLWISSYLHASKDDPNVMVNTANLKKAAIFIETLNDPINRYADYFGGSVAEEEPEDEELPF